MLSYKPSVFTTSDGAEPEASISLTVLPRRKALAALSEPNTGERVEPEAAVSLIVHSFVNVYFVPK